MEQQACFYLTHPTICFYNEHGIAKARFELEPTAFSSCPKCGGTMYVQSMKDGYAMASPCPGARAQARMDRFNAANIPARFRDASFDNFNLDSLPGRGKTIESMFIRKIREFRQGQRGIILEGGPGTGKTHLLCAAAHYLTIESNLSVRYVDFSVLLSEIRSIYQSANASQSEAALINDLVRIPILFLDELGKGRDRANEFEMRIIDEIINRRYNDDGLTTFFASNYRDQNSSSYNLYRENGIECLGDPAMKAKWIRFAQERCRTKDSGVVERFTAQAMAVMKADHLENRLLPRIVSRIFEMANPIVIEAQDYRARIDGGSRGVS